MENEPVFKKREAFKIVGVERYTSNGIPSIQEAWSEFSKRSKEVRHSILPGAYGIEDYSRDFEMNKGGFPKYYYLAGYEVSALQDIPQGMVGKEIAEANYAVFTYNGPITGLHQFFEFIYGAWLPKSGYSMDPKLSLDFEHYPEREMDMNAARIEIWVPVVKE